MELSDNVSRIPLDPPFVVGAHVEAIIVAIGANENERTTPNIPKQSIVIFIYIYIHTYMYIIQRQRYVMWVLRSVSCVRFALL